MARSRMWPCDEPATRGLLRRIVGASNLVGLTLLLASRAAASPAITMDELHRFGGAPPGWRFAPPVGDAAAGRQAFAELGCPSCHVVQGEAFSKPAGELPALGPELTGMGSHHPPAYFAESILNPNAVRVAGPGYLGPDGNSTMPNYPGMTVAQLGNLVAYLSSLKGTEPGSTAHCAVPRSAGAVVSFAQAFEVDAEQLDSFYAWFEQHGFRDHAGLVSIQTMAGRRGQAHLVLVVFGFDSEPALNGFVATLEKQPKKSFLHPVDRYPLRSPPLYRVEGMSTQ